MNTIYVSWLEIILGIVCFPIAIFIVLHLITAFMTLVDVIDEWKRSRGTKKDPLVKRLDRFWTSFWRKVFRVKTNDTIRPVSKWSSN